MTTRWRKIKDGYLQWFWGLLWTTYFVYVHPVYVPQTFAVPEGVCFIRREARFRRPDT